MNTMEKQSMETIGIKREKKKVGRTLLLKREKILSRRHSTSGLGSSMLADSFLM